MSETNFDIKTKDNLNNMDNVDNTNNLDNMDDPNEWVSVKKSIKLKPEKKIRSLEALSVFNNNSEKKSYNNNNNNNNNSTIDSSRTNSIKSFNSKVDLNLWISVWAKKKLNTNLMIQEYNSMKNLIENPKFIFKNILEVISNLTQNSRIDVIKILEETNAFMITMISKWADKDLDTDSMIQEYNSLIHLFEHPKFLATNIYEVIVRLAQNSRSDVLKILRESNPNYINKDSYFEKEPSPFHRLIWPFPVFCYKLNDAKSNNPELYKSILNQMYKTFEELLIYGFNMFIFNNLSINSETFLMCFFYEDGVHKILKEIRLELYNMIVNNFNRYELIDRCIYFILNNNVKKNFVCDKILYFLQKFPTETSKKIINWLCSMQLNNGLNSDICNIIDAIMSSPTIGNDYHYYLINHDLNGIRNNFVDIVLANDFTWIEKWLEENYTSDYKTDNEIDRNYTTQVYSNIMIFYGKFYSYSINQDKIILKIIELLDSDNQFKLVSLFRFIEYCKIDFNNLTPNEIIFIKKFNENLKVARPSIRIQAINIFARLLNKKNITSEEIYKLGC